MKLIKTFSIIILICACGCQPVPPTNTNIVSTSTPQISIATSSRTPTKTPTFTATIPIETTFTPLPTLNSREASLAVQKLLVENGNCELPCWWGIIPGETSWENTRNFLSPIANSIYESSKMNSNPAYYEVFFPAPSPSIGEFRQEYLVQDGIVTQIEILPQHYSMYSSPKGLLQEFGIPDMVFLGGSIDQSSSFQLVLYYPNQGIFALYVTEWEPAGDQENVEICFTNIDYTDLFLWDTNGNFTETKDYIFKQYENRFYDIETVTNLKISDFYEHFTRSDQPDCFKTQSKLWSR